VTRRKPGNASFARSGVVGWDRHRGAGARPKPHEPDLPNDPRKQRPASNITPAPDHEPSKPASPTQASPVEEAPIATAVIPPPVVEPPAASAEPKKPITAEAPKATAEPDKPAKRHKRTARRTRYARRLHVPDSARWNYAPNAATRGWGGGQFGPSPYSSNGQSVRGYSLVPLWLFAAADLGIRSLRSRNQFPARIFKSATGK